MLDYTFPLFFGFIEVYSFIILHTKCQWWLHSSTASWIFCAVYHGCCIQKILLCLLISISACRTFILFRMFCIPLMLMYIYKYQIIFPAQNQTDANGQLSYYENQSVLWNWIFLVWCTLRTVWKMEVKTGLRVCLLCLHSQS